MTTNAIREATRARIAALVAQQQQAAHIPHMGMRGAFCERLLKDFFREVIPRDFSVLSGIVCDCFGATSPQLDMIVTDDSQLPPLALHEDTALVPMEAALMVAEIKTRLVPDALDQVSRQTAALAALRTSNRAAEGDIALSTSEAPIHSFVLALGSDVSKQRVLDWMTEHANRNVVAVCVVGKETFMRDSTGKPQHEPAAENPPYEETLKFTGALYHALRNAASAKAIRPNWQQYMTTKP